MAEQVETSTELGPEPEGSEAEKGRAESHDAPGDLDAAEEGEDVVMDAVPETEGMDAVPEAEGMDAVPEAEGMDAVLEAEGENAVPETESENAVPETESENAVPETESENADPETKAEDAVPQTDAEDPIPQTDAEDPVHQTEAEDPIPQTEAEDPIPQTEAEDPIPQTEAEDPIPQTEAEDPVTEAEAEDPIPQTEAEDPVHQTDAEDPVPQTEAEDPILQTVPEDPVPEAEGEDVVSGEDVGEDEEDSVPAAEAEDGEDLEDGEIDDDEEEDPRPTKEAEAGEVSESLPRERRHSHRSGSSDPDGGDDVGEGTSRHSRHQKKDKKDKSGRRERSKRSLKEELRSDEEKKRLIKEKLRALERQMGGNVDEEEDDDNLDGEDSGAGYNEADMDDYHMDQSPPRHHRTSRKRKAADEEEDQDSLEHDPSDSKRGRAKSDKRGHVADRKDKRHKSKDICQLYMQGKCPRNANQCHYSHDAVPPQIMELCKFYLFERCAKKDKCLYLHKGFPCKFYHTGLRCMDTDESCKFSHEPLNDITRKILLKHLETAPNEILGDFPRYNRESALAVVFQTEAKHKGWNTEEDNPEFNKKPVRSAGDNLIANSSQADHLFQQSTQNGSDENEGKRRISRWDKPGPSSFRPSLPPPKVVQGPTSMFGQNSGKGLLGPRPGALLPHPPLLSIKINPLIMAPQKQSFPPGYGEDQLSEEQISNFLKAQKLASQINHQYHQQTGSNQVTHQQTTNPNEYRRDFNEENEFEEDCPKTPIPDEDELMDSINYAEPPKPQHLFDRTKQAQALAKEEAKPLPAANGARNTNLNNLTDKHGFDNDESYDNSYSQTGDDNWYSSDDEDHSKDTIEHHDQKVRTSPKDFSLPVELTAVLSSLKKDGKLDTSFDSSAKEESQNFRDPRRNRDPRMSKPPQTETKEFSSTRYPSTSAFKSEVDKDRKILEMDLSIFGELELPAFKDPEPEEELDPEQERLGLPFKPHRIHPAAKEIDASIHAHPPFEYKLTPIPISKPDYSYLAAAYPISRVQQDPRLRRYAKKRPNASDPVDSSPPSYQQQTSEPPAKNDRPSDPRRKNPSHTAPNHLEPLATYNPKNDLHPTRNADFHRQSNNFDTGYQNRRGGPPQDDGYRQQDGQHHYDDWEYKNNNSGQWGPGRGNQGQDQWSDPRGNQEHVYGGGNHGSQPYNRSFNSFSQGRGSGMGHRGAGGGPQRNADPRLQRDPRYQKC